MHLKTLTYSPIIDEQAELIGRARQNYSKKYKTETDGLDNYRNIIGVKAELLANMYLDESENFYKGGCLLDYGYDKAPDKKIITPKGKVYTIDVKCTDEEKRFLTVNEDAHKKVCDYYVFVVLRKPFKAVLFAIPYNEVTDWKQRTDQSTYYYKEVDKYLQKKHLL